MKNAISQKKQQHDFLSNDELLRAKHLIDSLILDDIIMSLRVVDKWNKSHIDEACKQYRNFLYLQKKYGHQFQIPPSEDIDTIWHKHILLTKEYSKFCQELFHDYLHHNPRHGYKSGGDNLLWKDELNNAFETNTQRLYFEEFGTYLYQVSATPFLTELKRFFYKHIWCPSIMND